MLSDQVVNFYKQHKNMISPLRWVVRITPQTLWYLENKDRNHSRSQKEISIRSKCLLYVDQIISKSHLYQERKIELSPQYIKKDGKKIVATINTEYFGLVWIKPIWR